jgi:hypothetical protein
MPELSLDLAEYRVPRSAHHAEKRVASRRQIDHAVIGCPLQPAHLAPLAVLEGRDVVPVAERQRNRIDILQQALLAERIDLEPVCLAVGPTTICAARSIGMVAPGNSCSTTRMRATRSAGRRTGSTPLEKQLSRNRKRSGQ